jgi:serine protease Do
MRPSGLSATTRQPGGRRPAGPAAGAWLCVVGIVIATASPAAAEETESTLPVALQRIYSAGAPANLDELRLMDAHQRDLIQRLAQFTVGIEIGPTQGSGVIISSDGVILTAAHVAGTPGRNVRVWTSDGQQHRGKTLGVNYDRDAGLIKITPSSTEGDDEKTPAEKVWPHAEMGDMSPPPLGSWCLALGHPGGYQLDRQPPVRFGRVLSITNKYIETDCILIGGDSGGPLFDMEGRVIGIHSSIGSQLNKNMHVPVYVYRDHWNRLVRGDAWGSLRNLVGRPVIGVTGDPSTNAPKIAQVLPASPADSAGLKPGDLVLRFGDDAVKKFDDLKEFVGRRNPGDEVVVVVMRGTETLELPVIIGSRQGD